MAKKVWIGVGIGCGTLVLIAVIAVGGGIYWMKHKFAGLAEIGAKVKAQKAQLAALEEKYPFTPPADGTLTLAEPRLQDYLAIRTDANTAFQKFEAQADALKEKKKASVTEGVQAVQTLMALGLDVEHRYIQGLDQHHMSPSEFQALSDVAYSEPAAQSPNAALLGKYKAQLEKTRNPALDGVLETGDIAVSIKHQLKP
jgi:hypothetical protein